MQKAAPTLGRVLVMVGFALSCFGLVLFLWLAFGGPIPLEPKGYRFHVRFPEATQLAKEADVRISGVPVGKVRDLQPDVRGGVTDATIELDPKYAPLPRDSRAILRQKTLLGETYVELTPGTKANVRNAIPENGTLGQAQVAPTVQLDEIFRAFDARTRRNFQGWMEAQAGALQGRGPDINDTLGNLAPFAEDTNALVGVLNSQHQAVRALVRNTGEVLGALSARDHQLSSLIKNSDKVFGVTARQNRALADTFRVLPTFQRETRTTLASLDAFAANANPLVNQLRPAARELSPTLLDLKALSPDLRALLSDLGPLIVASRRGLPAADVTLDRLRPVLGQFDPFLRQLNPALRYLGFYKPELNSFFANPVASTQAVDFPINAGGKPVHYLRTTNPVNLENLSVYPRRLGINRTKTYYLPGDFDRMAQGLTSFETRQCNRGLPTPTLVPALIKVLQDPGNLPTTTTDLLNAIVDDFFGSVSAATSLLGNVLSPPCVQTPDVGPQTAAGSGAYPHLEPDGPASRR